MANQLHDKLGFSQSKFWKPSVKLVDIRMKSTGTYFFCVMVYEGKTPALAQKNIIEYSVAVSPKHSRYHPLNTIEGIKKKHFDSSNLDGISNSINDVLEDTLGRRIDDEELQNKVNAFLWSLADFPFTPDHINQEKEEFKEIVKKLLSLFESPSKILVDKKGKPYGYNARSGFYRINKN